MDKNLPSTMTNIPPWDTNTNLLEGHPELHHYTTGSGLKGILESQTIFATNFKDVNDRSEISHLKSQWQRDLEQKLSEELRNCQELGDEKKKFIGENGEVERIATDKTKHLIETFHKTAFGDETIDAKAKTFIASFCSHANDHSYEKENGLLSQWRGYGNIYCDENKKENQGRFAIVFNTKKLDELLNREWEKFYYVALIHDSCKYYEDPQSINNSSNYKELIKNSMNHLHTSLINPNTEQSNQDMINLLASLLKTATFVKHRAFKEEREIRIFAMPYPNEDSIHAGQAQNQRSDKKRLKQIINRGTKEHIRLFEDLGQCLPIERIIVGPSKKQDEDFKFAEDLTRVRLIKLVKSETPYVG